MGADNITLVMIPKEELEAIVGTQREILEQLKQLGEKGMLGVPIDHITAKEFMEAVRIRRTKFDQLVNSNRIKVVKKRRKIYVAISEVKRYFTDPQIQ